ncbi:hypothetical protein L21_0956 [Methanoculleus chikugoensis]|jgi:hypothetical protein|uniref:Uncharacterized protein n=1 Tax=Methanoculleus chikugoensis TaxID=118126 RepID=A0A1M4MJM4_9EURY|nr:hypothetical protein L21_0956 [Methanoculleus chikugoensis]
MLPLPVGPPKCDALTVHCPGICSGEGECMTHLPWYGFHGGIAMTAPAPRGRGTTAGTAGVKAPQV